MPITKLPLVLLVFIASVNQATILIANPSLDESSFSVVKDLINIVTTCYGKRIDAIGFVAISSDALIKVLSTEHGIPVTLIDSNLNTESMPSRAPVQMTHKLPVFIIEASSHKQLISIVHRQIKLTIWWNHMAEFFILDRSPGCKLSLVFTVSLWVLELLNGKVICRPDNTSMLFNFNPFTTYAPAPWRLWITRPINGHPFTAFTQWYRANETMCENLHFDKVKNLGGFTITVHGPDPSINYTDAHAGKIASQKWNTINRTWITVFSDMNVTPEFMYFPEEERTKYDGDITIFLSHIHNAWTSVLATYPHEQNQLCIVSQFRGHKSQLNKILSVIDVDSRIGMIIVYVITFIFFKLFVRQALIPTVLNLVRITCNTGFTNLPANTPSRLFLAGLLFFVVTIQGIYQGNLAALLTQHIPLRDANTIQDILDLGYQKVYGAGGYVLMINHTVAKELYIELSTIDHSRCANLVAHDSSAVCIHSFYMIYDRAHDLKLHVSDPLSEKQYLAYLIRWDWPLEERINKILATLAEADIRESWSVKCDKPTFTGLKFDEEVMKNADFKIIELHEILFAFTILGIGLICATIAFIAEVVIYSHKTRIVNVRVQSLR